MVRRKDKLTRGWVEWVDNSCFKSDPHQPRIGPSRPPCKTHRRSEKMPSGKSWTNDELMIAMNLYCKLPFGQLRHGNPLIIEVAQKLGRTPSSLSMKLCNLASLDPYHQARGIKGLSSTSRADREIWNEFNSDWATVRCGERREVAVASWEDCRGGPVFLRAKRRLRKQPAIKMPT